MKKVLKSLILASIVALMVVTLTGCNNKNSEIFKEAEEKVNNVESKNSVAPVVSISGVINVPS